MAEAQQAAAESLAAGGDQFASLLQKQFKPKTDGARVEVERAVRTLAEQALRETAVVSDDVVGTIKAIIAEIDKQLTDQVNLILHNERFQQVESAWRGLHYLVNNTETDEMLKIRVLNISKKDLGKTLKKYKGASWDQSPLFKKMYEQEYGQLGGEPYGALVGDYYFDHTPGDVELLGQMAQIAAAAHAPFIAGGSPSLMGMDSWQELANPRDLAKIFAAPTTLPGVHCASRMMPSTWDWRCHAFSRDCRMARRAIRSKNLSSRKRPVRAITADIAGPMPVMRWPSTSTGRSRITAGARRSAVSSREARSKGCPYTHSPAMTAAST